jgi:hypothetical protein
LLNRTEPPETQWSRYRGIAGHTQYLATDNDPRHSFPAITAFITSYAREYMYHIIAQLPEGSVYYSATDSLFVAPRGLKRMRQLGLIHPTAIGKFKIKGHYKRGEVYGANYYERDGEIVAAGWAKGPPRPVGEHDMCEVWERLPGVVSRGPTEEVHVSKMPIGPYRPDRKGNILRDGTWQPYRLSADPDFTDQPKAGGYTVDDLTAMLSSDLKS